MWEGGAGSVPYLGAPRHLSRRTHASLRGVGCLEGLDGRFEVAVAVQLLERDDARNALKAALRLPACCVLQQRAGAAADHLEDLLLWPDLPLRLCAFTLGCQVHCVALVPLVKVVQRRSVRGKALRSREKEALRLLGAVEEIVEDAVVGLAIRVLPDAADAGAAELEGDELESVARIWLALDLDGKVSSLV